MDVIQLAHDELEAFHLCDGEGKTQEEAGFSMGISRGTIQRLLTSARRKVAQALVERKALAVSGHEPETKVIHAAEVGQISNVTKGKPADE